MGSTLQPQYGPPRAVNPVPRRCASIDKAAALLNFRARTSLEEGLSALVRWWRSSFAATAA
jgi:UDP-glucose 4-epimerase